MRSVPPELGSLTGLKALRFGDNNLSGRIPAELGGLHMLERLDLGGNTLTGPLPDRLGELTALTHLLLEDNDLEGPVPSEFGALTELREFNLTNNAGMTGMLPEGLTALTRLDVFLAGGTELCMPSEADFDTWLRGIWKHRIGRCPEASPSTAYLTQAVQSFEYPVPLVAGEDALLRAFVTARQITRDRIPPLRARFFLNDQESHVQNIAGGPWRLPTSIDESSLGKSANAVIPGHVVQPGLEMVIEVDPAGTLDPGLGVAKRIPETGRLPVDVRDIPTLELTLIPFIWAEDPDSSIVDLIGDMAADPQNHEMLHLTRTLLPVAAMRVRAHEPVLFPTDSANEILRATRVIRVMEGGTGYYKGMMAGNLGGIAYRPGWSSFSSPVGATLAHELGHNMNLRHAPCGGAEGPDPAYPHAEGVIGAWGYDFRNRALVRPSTPDLMTYCGPPDWVSDFYFGNALRYRLRAEDQPAAADRVAATRSLLLWGGVDADGSPFLEPAFVVDAPPALPDAAGDYRIAGRTADGTELFSLGFAMPEVLDGDGSSSFVFAVPAQPLWAGALASITLTGPGGSVVLDGDGENALAIVRDPRSGQVRGFLRGGRAEDAFQVAAMAAPGAGEAIEVLFSRGIPDAAAWQR